MSHFSKASTLYLRCQRCASRVLFRRQNPFRVFRRGNVTSLQTELNSEPHFTAPRPRRLGQTIPSPLSTLDPNKLQPQDFIDISSLRRPRIQLTLDVRHAVNEPSASDRVFKPDNVLELRYDGEGSFPPDSKGFLYYYTPPSHLPQLAGSIRFRLAKSKSDFEKGIDLPNTKTGLPWQIPLPVIAGVEDRAPLREKLLREGLTSPTLLKKSSSLWDQFKSDRQRASLSQPFIYYLEQPFHMRFNATSSQLWVVGRDNTLLKTGLYYMFCITHGRANEDRGSGIFRFEKYELESHVYLALRLLRIVEPIKWYSEKDGSQVYRIKEPVEGELIQRRHQTRRFGSRPELLFILHSKKREGLRELIAASNLRYSNFSLPSLSLEQGILL
ncbi:hypothetical protein AX15_000046 [Amanita polypyramis BW_CC]|nr:hypothetical protein AX15_000046 [Amanita polypyramis BW_CC]